MLTNDLAGEQSAIKKAFQGLEDGVTNLRTREPREPIVCGEVMRQGSERINQGSEVMCLGQSGQSGQSDQSVASVKGLRTLGYKRTLVSHVTRMNLLEDCTQSFSLIY
jgi:hypothetical protein